MKLSPQLHQLLNLTVIASILLVGGVSRAQTTPPVTPAPPAGNTELPKDADLVEVFLNEARLLSVDQPIDDNGFSAAPDNIVKITKVENTLNQLSLVGLATGRTVLTIKSGGRNIYYIVTVTPGPQRLYINVPESKRVSFPFPVDSTSLSTRGIVRVVQPDTDDKVLLIEAVSPGRTTLTVFVKDQIYRFFISTFENRGADILEIQNDFTAKGYRNLTVTFDNDAATLSGTVPTQEELDDAVQIIKQLTPYVVIHATIGEAGDTGGENSELEQIVINNIKRISNVSNISIRVKYTNPTVIETTTYTTESGDYVTPETTTTPEGGVVRGSGFLPPANTDNTDQLELKPRKNNQIVVTSTRNKTTPEKIFIYGDVEDDLQQARVLRVARTFCPFIVDFMTIRDPIQLRVGMRFMQADSVKVRNTGINWGAAGPGLFLGLTGATPAIAVNSISSFLNNLESGGLTAKGFLQDNNSNSQIIGATLHLLDTNNAVKELRESSIFLTNSQPGWYSEGEIQYYVSASTVTASSPPIVTLTSTPLFYGLNMDLSPLNIANAGGLEPEGQKILGVTITNTGNVTQEQSPSADPIGKVPNPIQTGARAPFVDQTTKYVDENGVIGMNIAAQLTIPNGAPVQVNEGNSQFITLPDYFVRTTRTRAYLRDDQCITLTGLFDHETSRQITAVPFFDKIPIFSALFKNNLDNTTQREVFIMVTPHIVRMRDGNTNRMVKPNYPAMQDMMTEDNLIPQIKPVMYEKAMDIRAEKDMKDVKGLPETPKTTPAPTPKPNTQASISLPETHSPIDKSTVTGQSVAVGQVKGKNSPAASATLP